MRRLRLILALSLAAPLAACATTSPQMATAKAAGTAESAYQAFVVAEEKLVQSGKLNAATFHTHEQAAYSALLAVRAGQMTVDTFSAKIALLTAGEAK